jgi:hypothetical protein
VLVRDGYTFLHVVFAAERMISAVRDELVIARPTEILPIYEVGAVAVAVSSFRRSRARRSKISYSGNGACGPGRSGATGRAA